MECNNKNINYLHKQVKLFAKAQFITHQKKKKKSVLSSRISSAVKAKISLM